MDAGRVYFASGSRLDFTKQEPKDGFQSMSLKRACLGLGLKVNELLRLRRVQQDR